MKLYEKHTKCSWTNGIQGKHFIFAHKFHQHQNISDPSHLKNPRRIDGSVNSTLSKPLFYTLNGHQMGTFKNILWLENKKVRTCKVDV